MKFFSVNIGPGRNIKLIITLFIVIIASSCATYSPQYGKNIENGAIAVTTDIPVSHRFVLVGDAGLASQQQTQQLLGAVGNKLKSSGKNTTLIFLGDNIYPHGMPAEKGTEARETAEKALTAQLELSKTFDGRIHFIPGNHDWYSGLKGLEEQEDFVKDYLKVKKSYLPGDGCAIDDIDVSDDIVLVVIDSEWFLEDWDDYPTMNDDCDIKTREGLFLELESQLNKNQDKTVILAIHHPLMSNGAHGGYYSARKHIYPFASNIPLPVIGSLINFIRKTSGVSPEDLQGKQYRILSNRVKTLIQGRDNVIVVSGHDHNLQYIHRDNIYQIISGAGSKAEAAKAVGPDDFTYGGHGYAVLDVYDKENARVTYFSVEDGKEKKVFEQYITRPEDTQHLSEEYSENNPEIITTSVYTPEMTNKSGFYKFLFGDYYRDYYSLPIEVKVASLDTLYGGLKPVREGGGHQSVSLRLEDKNGKEYIMRALRKSPGRFLQTVAFKDRYIGSDFDNTYAESFLMDFYTATHPFTPYIIDDMSDAVGIYHSNPQMYYVPRQKALGEYNKDFGGALYMFEERPADEHKNMASFGNPDAIESTDDVLENLRKDPKYKIDERAYIRARLFDMLLGDWDRHKDQWRWARYNEKDSVVYKPIPRDRDQAFPNYNGALLSLIMNIPAVRYMQDYDDEIKSVKWLATSAYQLDLALIRKSGKNVWLEESQYLKDNLTDEVIENNFAKLPVQDKTTEEIKANLKQRRNDLDDYALKYRKFLLKTTIITGTDKRERFEITRLDGGKTQVKIFSIKKEGETLIQDKIYNRQNTKELWIYALDDDDVFEVKGKPENPILIRLIGGQNNDEYIVDNGKKVKIYDFKSKDNTYKTDQRTKLLLTDDYETNTYDFKKPAYNVYAGYPLAGYNPDDGFKVGITAGYTVNNFNRRPYSQKHNLKAQLYFTTKGFELDYRGTFMNVASKWNFALTAHYTSPTFSINYFGYGNETENFDDELGMDYNRVKLQTFSVAPSFFKETRKGSYTEVQAKFETVEVEESNGRYVNESGVVFPYLFEHRQFAEINARYKFENYDIKSLPAVGMLFSITGGWKISLDETEKNFPYLDGLLNFVHRITADEKLVLSTTFKSRVLLNNDFEFYQAATLGGDNDLRGYRTQRFTGKQSYLQSTDIRFTIGRIKSSIIPMKYGIFGGYDYGRVWTDNDNSEKWHQSAGGGLWLNGIEAITARVFYFYGTDGGRIAFGLAFGL